MYPNLTELREYPTTNLLYKHSKRNIQMTNTEDFNSATRNLNPELTNNTSLSNTNDYMYNMMDKCIRSSFKDVSNEAMIDKKVDAKDFINSSSRDRMSTTYDRHEFYQGYSQPRVYLNSRENKASYSKNVFDCSNKSQERIYHHYSLSNRPIQSYNDRYLDGDALSSLQHKVKDDFIQKTLQTNIRLQKILAKIIKECRRDKHSNLWNNYINELKDKHGFYNDETTRTTQYVPEDYFNDEFAELQSEQVQNLVNEIYGCDTDMSANNDFSYIPQLESERIYFKNNNVCYPTSSQALINIRRRNYINEKYNRSKSIVVDSRFERPYKRHNFDKIFNNQISNLKETVVQTEINSENFNKQSVLVKKENSNTIIEKTLNTINTTEKASNVMNYFKRKLSQEKDDNDVKSFEEVQEKLDNLIESVNSVILAVKTLLKRKDNEEMTHSEAVRPIPTIKSVTDICNDIPNVKVNHTKNNVREIYQTNKDFITMILQNTNRHLKISEMSTSMSQFREFTMNNMDKVIEEEMEKSKKIKRDIQELLHTRCDRQCSVQLILDIPTKESKVINCPDSDIYFDVANQPNSPDTEGDHTRKVTIAVNTDPLSIPALLRVSTDALKKLLSYMPQLDYNTCVSMLPISRPSVPNYICYICGDMFSRMSQLSDHVQQHNLLKMRNCSACRHVLCVESNQIGPFECKYCEQRFTRSYCCELHQQNCAKSLDKKHHDLSYLLYLK